MVECCLIATMLEAIDLTRLRFMGIEKSARGNLSVFEVEENMCGDCKSEVSIGDENAFVHGRT